MGPLDGIDDRLGQGDEGGQRPVFDRGSFPVRLVEQDRDVFLIPVDPSNSGYMNRAAGLLTCHDDSPGTRQI